MVRGHTGYKGYTAQQVDDFYPTIKKFLEEVRPAIFDQPYLNLVKPERIVPYIQEEGTTVVFCDGGHKIGEFNSIAPHIKTGDFILAHDYIDTWDNFQTNYRDKIWNWCEVEEKYIEKTSIEQGLEFYNKEEFDKIVWVCKKKVK
jgi:hypothetical protein